MRFLIALLVLLLPGVAGAHDTNYGHGHVGDRELELISVEVERESDRIERFLSSQVQPEIEAGDQEMRGKSYDVERSKSIAHYVKALVLIEQEKLRRDSR